VLAAEGETRLIHNTEVILQCVAINLTKWMQGIFYCRPSSENTFWCAWNCGEHFPSRSKSNSL